jgi:putative transposase
MGSTLTNIVIHVIFSTKNREPKIVPEIRDELYRYIGGIIKGEGGILIEIGGISEHIHLLIKIRTVHTLADILKKIKGNSSRWVNDRKQLKEKFAWQEGYGAFSVSESKVPGVMKYLREQEKHHRSLSFKEEFIRLLELHRVEYDGRYLWK